MEEMKNNGSSCFSRAKAMTSMETKPLEQDKGDFTGVTRVIKA